MECEGRTKEALPIVFETQSEGLGETAGTPGDEGRGGFRGEPAESSHVG